MAKRKQEITVPIFCKYDRLVDASGLKAHPDNAHRSHPAKQLDKYEAVIRGNGWRKAVVISKRSGFIVKGHGAWLTAQRAGWLIPVEEQDYSSLAEERRDLIADNRLSQEAVTDEQKLAQLLSEMDAPDVELSGYDQDALSDMLATMNDEAEGTRPAYGAPIIQYAIIFDDERQQEIFYKFLVHLKQTYPAQPTVSARLAEYITASHDLGTS
jgi:hypothetical protein